MDFVALETSLAQPLTLSQSLPLSFLDPYGLRTISPATRQWLINSVNRLIDFAGDIPITAVTPRLIHQWQNHLTGQPLSPVSINTYLRGLKTFYSRLQRNGTTGHNPAQPVKYLPEPPPHPKAIQHIHYNALLQATTNTTTAVRDCAILSVLWGTGCRIGELLNMDITRVENISQDHQLRYSIYVIGKGRKPRWLYLKDDEAHRFQAWLKERPLTHDPAVFLSIRQTRLTAPAIGSIFRRLKTSAHLPPDAHANPHAFRHSFAVRKLNEGYDLPLVSAWLGHHSPEFTARVYVIRSETELRQRFFSPPPNNGQS